MTKCSQLSTMTMTLVEVGGLIEVNYIWAPFIKLYIRNSWKEREREKRNRMKIEKALDFGFWIFCFLEANRKGAEYRLRSSGEEEGEGRKEIRYRVFLKQLW